MIDEATARTTANYVAGENDIAIICIQTVPPGIHQLGLRLDLEAKRYIGLPVDRESWAIVSETNVDTWPPSKVSWVGQFVQQFEQRAFGRGKDQLPIPLPDRHCRQT